MRARALRKSGGIPGLLPTAKKTNDLNLLEAIKSEFARRRNARLDNLARLKKGGVGYFTNKKYADQNLKNMSILDRIIAQRTKEKNLWAIEDTLSINKRIESSAQN
tara:strand:- start:513 stop:830 length:318 start_codon:yes stop_codon:yes gene_type:complete